MYVCSVSACVCVCVCMCNPTQAIHPRFLFTMNAMRPRLSWKMSVDLSRPLVPSEGNLDPIDGYVTDRLVQQVRTASSKPRMK